MDRRAQECELVKEEDGEIILCRPHTRRNGDLHHQLVVPANMRGPLLAFHHSATLGGHFGVSKTLERVKENFHWDGMAGDVRRFISKCLPCALSRKSNKARHGLLQIRNRIGFPGESVSIDLLGPLPTSTQGNVYAVILIDSFTLHTEVKCCIPQTIAHAS